LQVWATKRRRWLALASVTAVALAGLAAARGNGHARRAA
jgi:hypothetical protein